MKKIISFSVVVMAFLIVVSTVFACTSIGIKTEDGFVFYARTMEGGVDYKSTISIVPKGTIYQGTLPDGTQKGLSWTTKYGVVGMNTYSLPIISDGINEMGLAAGNLMFPSFAGYQEFEPNKATSTIAQYEVVTWILTNFANVDEVRAGINNLRVCRGPIDKTGVLDLHFAVHDASGKRLVIEYVKGELKVYDNPIGVMTNSPTFDWHMINLRNHINISAINVPDVLIDGLKETGLGQGTGMLGLPGDYTPPSRFVRMVALVSTVLPVSGADAGLNLAMTIINNVDIPKGVIRDLSGKDPSYDITDWTVVADLGRRRYYFHTYNNKDWSYVDVAKSLANAKGIMSIPIEVVANYQDVTSAAKDFGPIPVEYFPAGKP